MFEDACKVAETLGVPEADVKPGAKVQKIIKIHFPHANTQSVELWVMDSFAHALSSKWSSKFNANAAAKKIKDFDSLTKIEVKLPEVTYFCFVLSIIFLPILRLQYGY